VIVEMSVTEPSCTHRSLPGGTGPPEYKIGYPRGIHNQMPALSGLGMILEFAGMSEEEQEEVLALLRARVAERAGAPPLYPLEEFGSEAPETPALEGSSVPPSEPI
jgi:hypothetical protein